MGPGGGHALAAGSPEGVHLPVQGLRGARSGEVHDGTPDELVVTQRFWSFNRDGRRWRLDRIRPADDADELLGVLNALYADRFREFQRTAPETILTHGTAVDC